MGAQHRRVLIGGRPQRACPILPASPSSSSRRCWLAWSWASRSSGFPRFLHNRDEMLVVLATFGVLLMLEDAIMAVFRTDPFFAHQPMSGARPCRDRRHSARRLWAHDDPARVRDCARNVARDEAHPLRQGPFRSGATTAKSRSRSASISARCSSALSCSARCSARSAAPTSRPRPPSYRASAWRSSSSRSRSSSSAAWEASRRPRRLADRRAGPRAAVHKFPEYELFVIYVVMALVLTFRREGLFAPPKLRRI